MKKTFLYILLSLILCLFVNLKAEELGNSLGDTFSEKCMITNIGGIAVKLTNKTGAESIKGYVVETSSWVASAVDLIEVDEPDAIGVFYESGIADGDEAWVVISGIADVHYSTNTAIHYFSRAPASGDLGAADGKAFAEAVPSPPFSTNKHFQEIGHVLEDRVGEGLAKTMLHFN